MPWREPPLSFDDFKSLINSLYSVAVQREYLAVRSNRLVEMVFGHIDEFDSQEGATRLQAMRAANCLKILGKGVIRVVHRVEDARESNDLVQKVVARCELAQGSAPDSEDSRGETESETGENANGQKGILDLSNCQLMQVPDAVFYMMRNTPLIECNLSSNVISKIPPKLPTKFAFVKRLNLSNNRMSTLPDEMRELSQLEMVDISNNSFISLPQCLFAAPRVSDINAKKNFITDVDVEIVTSAPKLNHLCLEDNPLTRATEQALGEVKSIQIVITPRELEEWEDLTA
eukprot:maker-scaffold294_size218657-snap-gene-0.18 protein:Tk10429 transcript:maker-scaffold294_size218657-snap-gene-0.18-mRNA-1 annotation:"leucine-rich repeat-containing protein 40 isoform x2"